MQMRQFRDDTAMAWSGKWRIRLLSQASFTLAPGPDISWYLITDALSSTQAQLCSVWNTTFF